MAKALYAGVSGVARKAKKIYIGDTSGKARKVKKMYVGDNNGKARLFWSGSSNKTLRDASTYVDSTSSTTARKVTKSEQDIPTTFTEISYPDDSAITNGLVIKYDYINRRFIGVDRRYSKKIFYMPDGTDTWTFKGSAPNYNTSSFNIDPKDGNILNRSDGYGWCKTYITGSSITQRYLGSPSPYSNSVLTPMEKIGNYYIGHWRYAGGSSSYGTNYVGGFAYIPVADIDTATTVTLLIIESDTPGALQPMTLAHNGSSVTRAAIAYINGKYCSAFVHQVTNSVSYRYDFYAGCDATLANLGNEFYNCQIGSKIYQSTIRYLIFPLAIIGTKMFFETSSSPIYSSGSYITSSGIYSIDFSASTITLTRIGGMLEPNYFNYYCEYFIDGEKVYVGNSRQGGTRAGTSNQWLGGYKYSSNGTSWTAVNFTDCSGFSMDKVKEKDYI